MKQIIVELDDALARRLERVAPGRSRKRSEFVRRAIAEALDRAVEAHTAKAYRRVPDAGEGYLDSEEWEPREKRQRR